jgi:hypothetical protein
MIRFLSAFFFALLLSAQTQHAVTLNWADALNPAGTSYNIYRASGGCSGTPTYTKINAAPVTAKTYDDNGISPGNYCYVVRAEFSGIESADSNMALTAVRPFGVTITVIVKQ